MPAATAVAVAMAALVVCAPDTAVAQATADAGPALRPWRPVVSLAGTWLGAQALGRVDATTRRAAIGTATPAPFVLFSTDSTLGGAAGGEL
ncbi:MAG TPA: hypothetical protein VMW48_07985, partial [Vicinamibacterales bacterium]|nr:hypothetical protein [Vicinamibacterales bacterium]